MCDEIYRIGKAGLKTLSEHDYMYVGVRNRFAIIGQERLCWYNIYVKKSNVYVYGSKYKRLVERDGINIRFGYVQYFV